MAKLHFPGESPEYRRARGELLRAEIDLRRAIETVAASRRALPPGGLVPEDYVFEETDGRTVNLASLFAQGKDTLVVYSFMYGPGRDACPACTSVIDALDGTALHASQRVNVAVVAKSPAERMRAFAEQRGWRHVRLLSSAHNSYNRDYFGEDVTGAQQPMLNTFIRRDGEIRHFWSTELCYAPADDGQNERHVDFIWPLWNLLDTTPAGRGSENFMRLSYD